MSASRLASLDSIRGIAALVVVLHHAVILLPPAFSDDTMALLRLTPLAPLLAGQPAVIVFFVLSGLVLTVALEKGTPYLAYAAARLVRLWLPLAAAVLLAAALALAFGGLASGDGLVGWFPTVGFNRPDLVTADLVLRHMALTGRLSDETLDTVIWSLAIEVRLSLAMPLIILAVRRWGLGAVAAALGIGLLAELALIGLVPGIERRLLFRDGLFLVNDWTGTALATLAALPAFAIGSWLAMRRHALMTAPTRPSLDAALWIGALIGLGAPSVVATALAAGLLLAAALRPGATRRALEHALPRWFGTISYSLYLIHFPVLFAAVNLLADTLAPAIAILAGVAASIALSAVFHRIVEAPSIGLARRLAAAIGRRRDGRRAVPQAPQAEP